MKTIALILIANMLALAAFSQTGRLRHAEKLFDEFAYLKASKLYEKLAKRPGDYDDLIQKRLAVCYMNLGNSKDAEVALEKVMVREPENSDYVLLYSMALRMNGKFAQSKEWMVKYSHLNPFDGRGLRWRYEDGFLQKIYNWGDQAKTVNLSVNTEYSDFGAIHYNGGILFSSAREVGKMFDARYSWNDSPFLDIYEAYPKKSGTDFGTPKPFNTKVNTKFHDGPIAFTPDSNTVFFTRNNYYKWKRGTDSTGTNNLKLFTMKKEGDSWGDVKIVHFSSDDYSVGHAAVSPDGKYLYFTSDMSSGMGGTDIWYSEIDSAGTLGEPQNLGWPVNTEGNEMFPFISDDGFIYFSSEGHLGLGGMDIYKSKIYDSDTYGMVEHLGMPFNSHYDDFSFMIDSTNKKGYYASNRPGGKGSDDIYHFYDYTPAKDAYKLHLKIVESITYDTIPYAHVAVRKVGSEAPADSVYIDQFGRGFYVTEPHEDLEIEVNKKLFIPKTVEVHTEFEKYSLDMHKTIALRQIYAPILLGTVTDKKTGKPLPGVRVQIVETDFQNEVLDVETDIPGVFQKQVHFQDSAQQMYSISLEKDGFLTKIGHFIVDFTVHDTLYLDQIMDLAMSRIGIGTDLGKIVEVLPIYFDYAKWNIRADAATELDKIVKAMKDNPNMIIELGAHTDCRGSFDWNDGLSDKRAKSSAQYIISQGIDPSRISGRGYGESQLVNDCRDGVPCSEAMHQQNRRTEFIIVEL